MDFPPEQAGLREMMQGSEDETPKVKAPSTNRHWIITIVSVGMVCTFLTLSWSGSGLPHSIYEFIGLEAKHYSDFGLVPHWVVVSGLNCPNGYKNHVNGKYSWGGLMSHGRPWYHRKVGKEDYKLYYASHCTPKAQVGAFTISHPKHWHPNAEHYHSCDRKTKIDANALLLYMAPGAKRKVAKRIWPIYIFQEAEEAGALPPKHHIWNVDCGKDGWMAMPITIEGGKEKPRLTAKGSWQYLHTAMPGEKIRLEIGVITTSEDGSAASLGDEVGAATSSEKSSTKSSEQSSANSFSAELAASASGTMSGSVGLDLFGPSVESSVSTSASSAAGASSSTEASTMATSGYAKVSEKSAKATRNYQTAWKQSVEKKVKTVREFNLPSHGGYHALFQFKFDIQDSAGRVGTSLSNEFAFTPSGAVPPKCVPGGCAPDDCPHYQKCEEGYYLAAGD